MGGQTPMQKIISISGCFGCPFNGFKSDTPVYKEIPNLEIRWCAHYHREIDMTSSPEYKPKYCRVEAVVYDVN
jgi:hypothetical protein